MLREVTALLAQRGVTATASGLDEVRATLGATLANPHAGKHGVATERVWAGP